MIHEMLCRLGVHTYNYPRDGRFVLKVDPQDQHYNGLKQVAFRVETQECECCGHIKKNIQGFTVV